MGKPYKKELDQLTETYAWATSLPTDHMARRLRLLASLPLIAIGSGGSYTTADFVASLHRKFTGKVSAVFTPMEAVAGDLDLRAAATILVTAGGKNPDVMGAFKNLVVREPRRFLVFCTTPRTPLAHLAGGFDFVDFIDQELPFGKDGFLATNSLVASAILFARGYAQATGVSLPLPSSFNGLLGAAPGQDLLQELHGRCHQLWDRDTLIVLHGPATRSAAIDLESKFTEAALGNVQIADFRNFAHGRHHWLAKRSQDCAVLAFLTPDDRSTGIATLDLLPKSVPQARIEIPFHNSVANLTALGHVLHVVGSAGQARGIDPGKPGVPSFGRRIYHLSASEYRHRNGEGLSANEAAAIERKTGKSILRLAEENQLAFWKAAYAAFFRRLAAHFHAVVFDYDGTLCGDQDRENGPGPLIGRHLTRFLRAGVLIGIATGRGKSVRIALRKRIPQPFWSRVLIGYYNGGDLGLLSDDLQPDGREQTCDALTPVQAALKAHASLQHLAKFEYRQPQIKVEATNELSADSVWGQLVQLVHQLAIPGVTVQRSSHSMDVLAPQVCKRRVVDALRTMHTGSNSVLCIGDRGQWPGNDFALLSESTSVSVDEVSQDPDTCWNLVPAGFRSVQACLYYLESLKTARGLLAFSNSFRRRIKP